VGKEARAPVPYRVGTTAGKYRKRMGKDTAEGVMEGIGEKYDN